MMRIMYSALMLITLGAFLMGVIDDFGRYGITRAATERAANRPLGYGFGMAATRVESPPETLLTEYSEPFPRTNQKEQLVDLNPYSGSNGALVHAASLHQEEIVKSSPAWTVSQSISPVDDGSNVLLQILSTDVVPSRFGQWMRLALSIQCSEGKTRLSVDFGDHFMVSSKFANWGEVSYRIDGGPATTESWTHTTDNETLQVTDVHAIRLAGQLVGAKKMLIRATPFAEGPLTASFDIAGLDLAIRPLRSACRW